MLSDGHIVVSVLEGATDGLLAVTGLLKFR
jgi:hypothetical protein